jgi:hypothetical protein
LIEEDCDGPSKLPFGRVAVRVRYGGAQIVDVEAVLRERARIELDAHRRPLPSRDADHAHARQLRDLLREPREAQVLDVDEVQRFEVTASVMMGASAGLNFA